MDSHTTTLINLALDEDLGKIGDLTATYFIAESDRSTARMISREPCALSGVEVAAEVFRKVDASLEIEILRSSGEKIAPDEINRVPILQVTGSTRSILTAERTALNFAQRLTGIATTTAAFVERVRGTNAVMLDTRKTTPGWRRLQKAAVVHGGGRNHRMGLYDRVMVKDNHLAAEDGLTNLQKAIDKLKSDHPKVEVELEADRIDQVRRFFEIEGVDYVLLDNMSLQDMRQAVTERDDRRVRLEASGGINLDRVRDVAETGVDFISAGALTHSARAIDLSLELEDI